MFENLASLFSALGLGYLALTAWPLAKTDILELRLPNKYVLPAFPITWLGQLAAGITNGIWGNMLFANLAMLVTFLIALGIKGAPVGCYRLRRLFGAIATRTPARPRKTKRPPHTHTVSTAKMACGL